MFTKDALRAQVPTLAEGAWAKSTKSGPYSDNCVEVAPLEGGVGVRDSKEGGAGPVLVFTDAEWDAFKAGVEAGEF